MPILCVYVFLWVYPQILVSNVLPEHIIKLFVVFRYSIALFTFRLYTSSLCKVEPKTTLCEHKVLSARPNATKFKKVPCANTSMS